MKSHVQDSKKDQMYLATTCNECQTNPTPATDTTDWRYVCGEVGHLTIKCKQAKKESSCSNNTRAVPQMQGLNFSKLSNLLKSPFIFCTYTQTENTRTAVLLAPYALKMRAANLIRYL